MTQNRFNKCTLVIKCKFGIDHVSSYTVKMVHIEKAGQRNSEGNHENECKQSNIMCSCCV